jgi:hypothetical protein
MDQKANQKLGNGMEMMANNKMIDFRHRHYQ